MQQCGLYIGPCSEGALVLENDQVKVVHEVLCDGADICITERPVGALEIEEREALSLIPPGNSSVERNKR